MSPVSAHPPCSPRRSRCPRSPWRCLWTPWPSFSSSSVGKCPKRPGGVRVEKSLMFFCSISNYRKTTSKANPKNPKPFPRVVLTDPISSSGYLRIVLDSQGNKLLKKTCHVCKEMSCFFREFTRPKRCFDAPREHDMSANELTESCH